MKKYLKCILLVTLIITSAIALSIGLTGCADARGHRVVHVEGYAPTCDKDGLTDGEYCDRCGKVYVEQQIIEKLGHDYESQSTKNATCTTDGYTVYKCGRCGDSYQGDVVEAFGHDYVRANCTRCAITDPEIFAYELSSSNSSTGSGNDTYAIVGLKIDYVPAIINIPSSYKGVAVTEIASSAFSGCIDLISISIPSSIKKIGNNAFLNCYNR